MNQEHPKHTQSDVYQRFVNDIAQGDTIAIVGAGSSCRVKYPNWTTLLKLLCEETTDVDSTQKDVLESLIIEDPLVCANKIKKILGQDKFYTFLDKIFGPFNPTYDEFHQVLTELPFKHFLTTNYDRILQVAYESSHAKPYVELDFYEPQSSSDIFDSIGSRDAQTHFLHVHGSIKNPKGIVLAKEDYDSRYMVRNDLIHILKHIFTFKVVFIGFSLSDEEFMGPLKFLTSCLGEGYPRHYAILPKPDKSASIAAVKEKLNARYRIEPIFYDSSDNHAFLIPLLKDLKKDIESCQKDLIAKNVSFLKSIQHTNDIISILQATENVKILIGSTLPLGQHDTTIPETETFTTLDKEITSIFSYVKQGRPEVAIEMYKVILEQRANELMPRLEYRLHANIGNALYAMNRPQEASREYIKATDSWISTKEARANRALGFILGGKYDQSLEITSAIINEYPDYNRAYALYLQSLSKDYPFKDARKLVPPKLRRDAEIAYALSGLAHEQGFYKRSEIYSKISWISQPDWIEAGLAYAVSILAQEREMAIICGGTKLIPRNIHRIKQVENILTNCLDKLHVNDPANRKGIFLYNRATAKRMLSLESEALSDLEEAYRCNSNYPEIIAAYALQHEADGERAEAIRILERYEFTSNHSSLSFLLANMLFQRSAEGDLEKALSILNPWCDKIDDVYPKPHRYDLLRLTSEILLKLNRNQDAINLVEGITPTAVPLYQKQLALMFINISSNSISSENATHLCEQIAHSSSLKPNYYFEREVAICADRIKHYQLSFNIWKRITSPLDFNCDTRNLLQVALHIKEYSYIIHFCTQLRSNGIHERCCYIIEMEAYIQCHEFNEAFKLMTEWLGRNPDDKEMRMNLSILSSQIGQEDFIERCPDRLPSIEEVPDPSYGRRVVHALSLSGNSENVISYAYSVWRKFPDDMEIRHLLIISVIGGEKENVSQVKPSIVQCGSAVIYKLHDSDQIRTHIIEDGPSPSLQRNEYPPDHIISKSLLGKSIGETVLINHREGNILEIHDKYSFVASKLLQNFCMEFPENPLMQEFRVPAKMDAHTDIQESLKEIRTYMQSQEKQQKAVEDLYQRGLLPIVNFANFMGKSVLETMLYFAASPKHKIFVCKQITNEFETALKTLSKNCRIVIDETAIATIFMLDIYKSLDELPFDLIIPESLLFELRKTITLACANKRSDLYLGISNGELVVQRVTPTEHANWINSLEELLTALINHCSIEGGRALLEFEPESREQLIQAMRPPNADAVAIAKKNNIIYWTDDQLYGALAAKLQIQNVWSQVILHFIKDVDEKYTKKYNLATKKLFLWGYDFTLVTVSTLIDIIKDAKWNINDRQVDYIEQFISKLGAINPRNSFCTCCLFAEIWIKCPKRKVARKLILRLLKSVKEHESPAKLARFIYRGQHELFRLNVNPKIRGLRRMLRRWRMNPNLCE